MMRRTLVIAAVLLVSGFLPLAASFGFCAGKACCRSHSTGAAMSMTSHSACCNQTNCTPARDTEATHAPVTFSAPLIALSTVAIPTVAAPPSMLAQRIDFGSPPTNRRLATLSILLI